MARHDDDPVGPPAQAIAPAAAPSPEAALHSDTEHLVLEMLARHGLPSPATIRRLHGYVMNEVYVAGEFVVKLARDAPSVHAEAWAMQEAARAGVGAPVVHCSGLEPRPYLIMQRLHGQPAFDNPTAMRAAGRQIRRLHEVRLGGAGWLAEAGFTGGVPSSLEDGSWDAFLDRSLEVVGELRSRGWLSMRDELAARSVVTDHRGSLLPPGGTRLCHGDVHPRHVYVAAGGLTGIIDWQDAIGADPVFDLARLSRFESRSLFDAFVEGYDPDPPTAARLHVAIPIYRMLWTAWTALAEVVAESDWLSHHVAAIRGALWELEAGPGGAR